jgi:hypothetical protein
MHRFHRHTDSRATSTIFALFAALAATSTFACSSSDSGPTPIDIEDGRVVTDAASEANDTTTLLDTPGADVAFDTSTDVVSTETDGSCGGTTITATARDASALLVLDKSGSMLQKPPGYATKKWPAMKTALAASLDKVKKRMSFGLELYPFDPVTPIASPCSGNCCAVATGPLAINVPIEAGETGVPKILAAIDAVEPGGATPTAEAMKRALEYFTTGAGKDLKGDKFVILATDGGPNCNSALTCDIDHCTTNLDGNCAAGNCCDPATGGSKIDCVDDASVVAQITALATAGVKTFVIGIPGSEAYNTFLDQFAEAGKMTSPTPPPKYFAVNAAGGVAGLEAVFDLITGSLITTCRLQLESDPADINKLNVIVDGKIIPQDGPDGWSLDTSTSPPSIVLRGATCATMETKGAKVVEIQYGCPTIK